MSKAIIVHMYTMVTESHQVVLDLTYSACMNE